MKKKNNKNINQLNLEHLKAVPDGQSQCVFLGAAQCQTLHPTLVVFRCFFVCFVFSLFVVVSVLVFCICLLFF